MFKKVSGNLIESEDGSIVRTGRAGLDVVYRGVKVRVSSEMMFGSSLSIVIYSGQTDYRDVDEAEFNKFLEEGLIFGGYEVAWQ